MVSLDCTTPNAESGGARWYRSIVLRLIGEMASHPAARRCAALMRACADTRKPRSLAAFS